MNTRSVTLNSLMMVGYLLLKKDKVRHELSLRGKLIPQYWRGDISRGYILTILKGKHEKWALTFVIHAS